MIELYDYQKELIERTRTAYINGYRAPCIVSPCGSGKSVMIAEIARKTTEKGNRVLFLVHRKELIDQIKNTFEWVGVNVKLVEFGMVQTIVRRLEKTVKPALIITDENHHALAASYKKVYDYFGEVPKLGFTATPIRLNGDGLGETNDLLIEGVSVSWLIENKRLAPYRYYAPKLINTDYLKMNSMSEFSKSSIDEAMQQKAIYGDVIKHYRKLADGQQAIAYCHSIDSSLVTRDTFVAEGISAEHIDAKTPKQERDEIINNFRVGKIKVLCNVDLIGEGFDVPDCSTVIMLRPTKSLSLFIQQSMRGMRFKEGKISTIIDHVGNVNEFGLPDMEREWSLDKRDKKQNVSTEFSVKCCPNCFGTFVSGEDICPYCGYEIEVEKAKELEVIDDDLEEIDKDEFIYTFRKNKKPEECKSLKELQELAKANGYKSGWAWHQAKILKIIK